MRVTVSHHIDATEPDANGVYDDYYEYDVYRFCEGEKTYTARVYSDHPERASFIGYEQGERRHFLNLNCGCAPLLVEAFAYLRAVGICNFERLSIDRGYVPFDEPKVTALTSGTGKVPPDQQPIPIGEPPDLIVDAPIPAASPSDHEDL